MKILCLTHADFESPGVIERWAIDNAHDFAICKPYKNENCLSYVDFDFLIIMGGPQSACNLEEYPYLKDEILLIKKAIAEKKIILGFCLGAQLIGEAMGAPAQTSPEKEIGVFPISLTQEGLSDQILSGFEKSLDVIHWHNDMPGLTPNSKLLAYSQGCPRQIIRYSERIYGFQCHLEITKSGIETMIEACPQDLAPSKFTQTKEQLLSQDYESINQNMIKILNNLSKLLV